MMALELYLLGLASGAVLALTVRALAVRLKRWHEARMAVRMHDAFRPVAGKIVRVPRTGVIGVAAAVCGDEPWWRRPRLLVTSCPECASNLRHPIAMLMGMRQLVSCEKTIRVPVRDLSLAPACDAEIFEARVQAVMNGGCEG